MSAHTGAVQKGHPELDAALLYQIEQTLPADEGLSRPPPGAQFSGHSTPLGTILVAPENGLNGPPQILRRCLALGTALFHQRLQHGPLRVRQHGSSSNRASKTPPGAKGSRSEEHTSELQSP